MNKSFILEKEELKKLANAKTPYEKDLLKKHYTNIFYKELVKYNTILSDQEFYNLCEIYVSKAIDDFTDKEYYLSGRIANLIKDEDKMLKKDNEKIILRYICYFGVNDKILKHFTNKYRFLLNRYKNKPLYDYVKSNFPTFVKLALENYDSIKKDIRVCIEKQISKNLENKKQNIRKDIKNVRNLDKEKLEDVKEYCFYIKYNLFDRYKKFIDAEILKQVIDEKFEDFFNAYLNGNSAADLKKYVDDRLVFHLEHLKTNQMRVKKFKDESNKNLLEKEYIVYWFEHKCKAFIPSLELIKEAYEKACYKYYELPRESNIEEYLKCFIWKFTHELDKKYDINYIKNITLNFKEKLNVNYFESEEQMNIILDNLEKYYIENRLYKTEKYEDFLTRMILSFNKGEYKLINDIKSYNCLKMLKK